MPPAPVPPVPPPPVPGDPVPGDPVPDDRPEIAVILILRDPADSPDAVLAALADQPEAAGFEVILADGRPDGPPDGPPDRPGDGARQVPRSAAPAGVTWIRAPGLNMPMLKACGIAASRAATLAFLEPKAVPQPGWAAALRQARAAAPQAAIGGAVRFGGCDTAADQAAFIFEYADFSARHLHAGRTRDLPGNNMALPRAALLAQCGDILAREGLNKPFCQARLLAAGVALHLAPGMAVSMTTTHRLPGLLLSRMRYARCFGGTRIALAGPGRRWRYRLGAPLVPLLVLARRMAGLRRAETGARRVGTLPALALLCLAWAGGEIAGYWGGAGTACEKLY